MQILAQRHHYPSELFTSIQEIYEKSVEKFADRTYVTFREEASQEPIHKTYRESAEDLEALSLALRAEATTADERIAILGENSYSWILTYFASVFYNQCVIPLDRLLKPDEILPLLERSEATTLFIDAKNYLEVFPLLEANPCEKLKRIYVMNETKLGRRGREDFSAAMEKHPRRSFKDLLASGEEIRKQGFPPLESRDPEAPGILIFTSGTTSQSKAVVLTQRCIAYDVSQIRRVVHFETGIRMLSVLPLSHTFENTGTFLTGTSFGAHLFICDGLRYISSNLKEYRIEFLLAVPALFEQIYKKIRLEAKKSGKLKKLERGIRISEFLRKLGIDLRRKLFREVREALGGELTWSIQGGAALNADIIRFLDGIGWRVLQGYGLTETSPVAAGNNTVDFVPGSIGYTVGDVEVAVDTDTPGEVGEILIRGGLLMEGYYRDPEATAEAIDADGWFHSGDLGRIDPKTGALFLTGRLKSMIVLDNGKKVFPEELEALLHDELDESVKELLVYPQEDRSAIVLTLKCVVDKRADDAEIASHIAAAIERVNAQVPGFKRIKNFYFTHEELIKTSTMKVKRGPEMARIAAFLKEKGVEAKSLYGRNIDRI
ncbi:MAG: AMP-binding protein [Eubacteriales bacterium]|nr:AMP-binding protein [Eubacteriales bacterium]